MENGSLSKDSDVSMEIPTHTTLAYALIELEVKQDGRYGEKSVIIKRQMNRSSSVTFHMWVLELEI